MTNFFNRLLLLCKKGLKKLAYLIREHLNLIEVKILLIGLVLTTLTGIYFLYLLFTDPGLYRVLSSTAIIHIMGGRALGIATCLSADISLFYTILYNFFLEIVIVLIAYGIVVLVMRNIIQPKLFDSAVRKAELTAYSARFRPAIPEEAGHPFRLIPATDSGRSRPPIPEHSGHPFN